MLKDLTKAEVEEVYKDIFLDNPRALEVHFYSPERKEEGVKLRDERIESGENLKFCKNVQDFKARQELFVDTYSLFI